MAKQMEYAVGTLTAFPDFLSDLKAELDGKVTNHALVLIGWQHSVMLVERHGVESWIRPSYSRGGNHPGCFRWELGAYENQALCTCALSGI